MPLFVTDDEFRLISADPSAVADRADAFIRDLRRQLDTVRAEADAASIASEQTCSLLEHRYSSLYSDFSKLQSENAQLSASLELHLSGIADSQAKSHQLHLKSIGKDGEIERLTVENAELQKAKRQLMKLVEQKDAEIHERNSTIQSYLDKIVNLTESNTSKEARIHESETELGRCRAAYTRSTQEKELLEKHNTWLNEELTTKVNSLVELRKAHMDVEADLSSKLADHERQLNESSNSLKWNKEQVRELEMRVSSLEEELRSSKEAAAANEERFAAELSTVSKLVELYKASSEEWSRKAGELEGVIKALETHLSQTEKDYKDKLEKELSVKKDLEKEAVDLREKFEKYETEIENTRRANELSLLPISGFSANLSPDNLSIVDTRHAITNENSHIVVPRIPIGISGTALATSLLREGWSLAKMYEKYQETNDALVHERRIRKHAQDTLSMVFHEIEEKLAMIADERAEHERMVEAYTLMDQKLQQALAEHDNLDNNIRTLKAELKMRQREYNIAEREINDLQNQVTVLLKECQDVQLRCGGVAQVQATNSILQSPSNLFDATDVERVISDQLLTFKDINGLIEQNVHLRRLVHSFSIQAEKRDAELKEGFHTQLQKVTDEAAAKVEAVHKRCEEQASMIESLHSSVAMYKRLYEEERKFRTSSNVCTEAVSEDGKKELMVMFEGSQEVSKKAHVQLTDRARTLEQDLATSRSELLSLRSERDKMLLEANFSKERLDSFMKEFDHQREEANAVSARNVELTHLLVDYQRRLRESSDTLQASEENSRKLSMEISILKHEKEILINSEKRASDEVRSLSERVYRLQSSLDTIHCTEEVRENAKATERRKLEEYLKRVEMEWAEAKKELQEERDRVRTLTLDKEKVVDTSLKQVDEMRKELSDCWRAVASAESRAAVVEAHCSDLKAKINYYEKATKLDAGQEESVVSLNEGVGELWKLKDELERLKEEARLNKEYMLQYKEISRTNETALKQMESAHEEYKLEAEKLRRTLEEEVQSLLKRIDELENNYKLKSEEAASAIENKEQLLSSAMVETSKLREDITEKLTQIQALENQVSSLKGDVDMEHKRWRTSQDNYERQVILQSETIQELTNTSKELSLLQSEAAKYKELTESQKSENDLLKEWWEKAKTEMQELRSVAERKYNEVNEQNKILHTRLEALHIKLADKEHSSSVYSSHSKDSQPENDLQNVISYLRRSKEIAETEIFLLKQEKLRLQAQLESALKASESAQSLLHSQCESSRTQLFNKEEFKSLQLQVREINLLRESNVQLRAENKHNFEECQKFRMEAQKARVEAESLGNLLKDKEVELEACRKEVEMLKLDVGNLDNRITELRESTKHIDAEEYEQMKAEFQHTKVLLGEKELEVQLTKNQISEKQECIVNLEQALAKCRSELAELEKKFNDALHAEANAKAESDKQKRSNAGLKRKYEILLKEKEELRLKNHEVLLKEEELHIKNQALLKQIEESKSSRKTIAESSIEQAKKDQEKDTRIQMLEKLLERQKDELKKEKDDNKLKQIKSKNTVLDAMTKIRENIFLAEVAHTGQSEKEKIKVEEELSKHRNAITSALEHTGISASQLPPGANLEEQTLAYFQSVSNFEELVNSGLADGDGAHTLATDAPSANVSATVTSGREVSSHQVRASVPRPKAGDEKEKALAVSKPTTEVRKAGRRLIRPRLERPTEPAVDNEVSAVEASTGTDERKAAAPSQDLEPPANTTSLLPASSTRKRLVSSSSSEFREDSIAPEEASTDTAPSLKKSKQSEALPESSSDVNLSISPETLDTVVEEPSIVRLSDMPTEEVEADDEPIFDEAKGEDDIAVREETEEQKEEEEIQDEGDAVMEELMDMPNTTAAMELVDSEDVKEVQPGVVDSEDEREEGELMPEEAEQQQQEDIGEEGEIGDEIIDATEVASPELQVARGDEVDTIEEVNTDSSDQAAPNPSHSPQRSTTPSTSVQIPPGSAAGQSPQRSATPVTSSLTGPVFAAQSPQKSAIAREESQVTHAQLPVLERRSPSPGPRPSTVESDEQVQTRVGRTITIAERARINAIKRQQSRQASLTTSAPTATPTTSPAAIATSTSASTTAAADTAGTTARGRGRASGVFRSTRGSRGRGGRGQT